MSGICRDSSRCVFMSNPENLKIGAPIGMMNGAPKFFKYYSYLKALIGFNKEALYAGKKPNNSPTMPEKLNGNRI